MWREVTTDLVNVRLHGHTRKYGCEVLVYFDNDAEGAAVPIALALHDELAAL